MHAIGSQYDLFWHHSLVKITPLALVDCTHLMTPSTVILWRHTMQTATRSAPAQPEGQSLS